MSQTTTGFATEYASTADLTESQRHDLLSAERRRAALDVLADRSTAVALADLAVEVAEREAGLDPTNGDTVRRLEIELHHAHLPRMDDYGVVDYDRDTHRITP
jgi:hypothetical protein